MSRKGVLCSNVLTAKVACGPTKRTQPPTKSRIRKPNACREWGLLSAKSRSNRQLGNLLMPPRRSRQDGPPMLRQAALANKQAAPHPVQAHAGGPVCSACRVSLSSRVERLSRPHFGPQKRGAEKEKSQSRLQRGPRPSATTARAGFLRWGRRKTSVRDTGGKCA